jgi:hypothetical protein
MLLSKQGFLGKGRALISWVSQSPARDIHYLMQVERPVLPIRVSLSGKDYRCDVRLLIKQGFLGKDRALISWVSPITIRSQQTGVDRKQYDEIVLL